VFPVKNLQCTFICKKFCGLNLISNQTDFSISVERNLSDPVVVTWWSAVAAKQQVWHGSGARRLRRRRRARQATEPAGVAVAVARGYRVAAVAGAALVAADARLGHALPPHVAGQRRPWRRRRRRRRLLAPVRPPGPHVAVAVAARAGADGAPRRVACCLNRPRPPNHPPPVGQVGQRAPAAAASLIHHISLSFSWCFMRRSRGSVKIRPPTRSPPDTHFLF
jgi:hypothetical protein